MTGVLDIVLIALPRDRARAEPILNSLVTNEIAGAYRTRLVTVAPTGGAWKEAVEAARAAACVIFCWSRWTQDEAAAAYRALAQETLMQGRALAVELDANTKPPAQASCTTYPLYGWRAQHSGPISWFTGHLFTTHIAAAAREKVLGRDPPPPFATRDLLKKRAWALWLGVLAVIGVPAMLIGLWNDGSQVIDKLQGIDKSQEIENYLAIGWLKPTSAVRTDAEEGGRFHWALTGIALLGGEKPGFSDVKISLAPVSADSPNPSWGPVDVSGGLDRELHTGSQSFEVSARLPELPGRVMFCLQRIHPLATSQTYRVDQIFNVIDFSGQEGAPERHVEFRPASDPQVRKGTESPCGK